MRLLIFIAIAFFSFSCSGEHDSISSGNKGGYVISLSIASDGKHVISAQSSKHIILWDIDTKQKQLISSNGNIFSAYFIRHSNRYLWQDLENIVHVQDTSGKTLRSFQHFPTYGHVMSSDLKHYFSSDIGWGLYSGYGDTLITLKEATGKDFLGYGKLLNLTLNTNTSQLLQSGDLIADIDKIFTLQDEYKREHFGKMDGVVIWDTNIQTPIQKISANNAKTYATLSPDGRYVVSGDENTIAFVWDIDKGIIDHYLASLHHGRIINREEHWEKWKRDKTGLITAPKDFTGGPTLSIKFVSNNYYLRIFHDEHYVALYKIDNDMPIKYFDLGDDPFPSVKEYYRNVSIDTAPEAGILVTGQHRGSGINVYKFDKDNLKLEKIWVTQ